MKVIEIAHYGGTDVLQVVEKPRPQIEAGQVLIENRAAGVNFADLMSRAGNYPLAPKPPFTPGFEVAGIIAEAGSDMHHLPVGTHVAAWLPSGGYSEYIAVGADSVIPLPDGLDFAAATALLAQGLTAWFMCDAAHIQPGDTVLVGAAAGGVGSLAVQIARLRGAGSVIGLASSPSKRQRVIDEYGAAAAIDYTQAGWSKQVREATNSKGVDIFFDASGELDGEGSETLANGGRWVVYGALSGGMAGLSSERLMQLIFSDISIIGFTVYHYIADRARLQEGLTQLITWTLSGELKVETGSRFALTDAAQAHEAMASRKTEGKVVLIP